MTADRPLAGVRVALLNWRDLEHSRAGGSEQYAMEFARALADGGADVQFLTSRERGQSRRGRVGPIEIRRGGGTYGYYLWVALRLLLSRRRLDVVVDVENGIPHFSPLFVRRSCRVVVVVYHVHLDQFALYFPAPVAAFGRFLEGWAMPRVYRRARAVTISRSTREEMAERLHWPTEVTVLDVGNPVEVVDGAEPGPGTQDRLLAMGRLVPHKRVDELLRSFVQLRRERPGLRLDILGRGPAEDELRELVGELGLSDSVTMHGFVPDERMRELIAQSRLHLCASDAEGWGLVVVEAAAYGVPTVARHVPGLRDSILHEETGWLLPDDGRPVSDQLTDGVLAALDQLDDESRRSGMAAACRDWAARFTWDRMRAEARAIVATELATGEARRTRRLLRSS